MGTQNITYMYKIQVNGEGFAYYMYTEHIVVHIKCHRLKQTIMY